MYSALVWVGEVGIIEVKSMFFTHSANQSNKKKSYTEGQSYLVTVSFVIHHHQVSLQAKLFLKICLSLIAALQEIRIWKWHPGFGRAMFINDEPCYACAAIPSTQAHITPQTQPSPATLCPCAAFCLQTELPWLALLMLIRSPVTLAFMVLLLWTQVQNANIKRAWPFLSFDVILILIWCFSWFFFFFFVKWDINDNWRKPPKNKPYHPAEEGKDFD